MKLVSSKAEVLARKYFLRNKNIGISISESDNLSELGFSVLHLKDAIIEITRYILATGGKVSYGGDMRQGGFTETFFDLLAYYKGDKELPPAKRFFSYLAFPISTTLTADKQAELKQKVTFLKVTPPEDLRIGQPNEFVKPDTAENLYIWARSLTKMREEMEEQCSARVFLGGRSSGYKGKYPGVLEELLIAIRHGHPVYLIGAFGGITSDIIEALKGDRAESLTMDFHQQSTKYNQMLGIYSTETNEKIDYDSCFQQFAELGLKGLSELNGLSQEDNLRLASTPHISEIVYLIIKGLTKKLS